MAYRKCGLAGLLTLLATAASATSLAQAPSSRILSPAIAPAGSLYARLGGTSVVSAFVSDTIDKVVANPEMYRSFDKVDLQHVKDALTVQICALTGGGCVFSSDTSEVPVGHHISNAEFFGLVEVLRESMRARDVPLKARNELLEVLAPMKRDVVKL